jgi:hypothetical protein
LRAEGNSAYASEVLNNTTSHHMTHSGEEIDVRTT